MTGSYAAPCFCLRRSKVDDYWSNQPRYAKRRQYEAGENDSDYGGKMTVYLVRHGADDPTVRGGWNRHGLTSEGKWQVRKLAAKMSAAQMRMDRIFASDLPRAADTAQILSDALGCPVEYGQGLREVNNGELAGMKNETANEKYPGLYWSTLAYDECYPGGESPEAFFHRVQATWAELKDRIRTDSLKEVLIVTHAGVIEAILCMDHHLAFSNRTRHFSAPNAQLIPIEIEQERG